MPRVHRKIYQILVGHKFNGFCGSLIVFELTRGIITGENVRQTHSFSEGQHAEKTNRQPHNYQFNIFLLKNNTIVQNTDKLSIKFGVFKVACFLPHFWESRKD